MILSVYLQRSKEVVKQNEAPAKQGYVGGIKIVKFS